MRRDPAPCAPFCSHLLDLVARDFVRGCLIGGIAPLYRIADPVERFTGEVNIPCRFAPPAQTLAGGTLTLLTCTHASMIPAAVCNIATTDTSSACAVENLVGASGGAEALRGMESNGQIQPLLASGCVGASMRRPIRFVQAAT